MAQINLNVSGMTCGSCVKHVKKMLESLEGVSNVNVDLQFGKAYLDRTNDRSDDLISALNEDGYPSSLDMDGSIHVPRKKSGSCCCG